MKLLINTCIRSLIILTITHCLQASSHDDSWIPRVKLHIDDVNWSYNPHQSMGAKFGDRQVSNSSLERQVSSGFMIHSKDELVENIVERTCHPLAQSSLILCLLQQPEYEDIQPTDIWNRFTMTRLPRTNGIIPLPLQQVLNYLQLHECLIPSLHHADPVYSDLKKACHQTAATWNPRHLEDILGLSTDQQHDTDESHLLKMNIAREYIRPDKLTFLMNTLSAMHRA